MTNSEFDEKQKIQKASKKNKIPKQKKEKSQTSTGLASISLLIALFDKLCDVFCNALTKGFFGRLFSCYTKMQKAFETGFLKNIIFGDRKFKKFFRAVRKFLSRNIESCFIVTRGQKMIRYFATAPLNFYGNFGLFFGIYTVIIYFVKFLIPNIAEVSVSHLIIGIALIILSIPFAFSKISFSQAIVRSFCGRFIFQRCLGVSDEVISKYSTTRKGKGNRMLFFGLVAGTLTLFVHPLDIIIAILLFALISFIAVSPEIGIILTVFAVPFCALMPNPTITLCTMVLVTAFFYIIKIIRGKRVFKLELVDAAVLLFGILIALSSIFSAGASDSQKAALVSCTLLVGYFLAVNLLRTEAWIKRCVAALISSATFVAFVGILEYFFAEPSNAAWLDQSKFESIRLRIVSFFENPNMLSTYLALVFPFVLAYLILSQNKNEKFLYFLFTAFFVCAIIMTWTRAAWIAVIISSLIFFTVYSRKTLRLFGLLFLTLPVVPMILPDNIFYRLVSIFDLTDSSISYRIYTWMGSIRAIKDNILGGIGYGQEAFANIYPRYAFSGIETAEHTHSLYLQITLAMGIGGLLTFILFSFAFMQKCSEYVKKPKNKASKFYVAAAISSIIAALIMGVFDYIWFSYRVFYIFWIVIAIGCTFVRIGDTESERNTLIYNERDRFRE